jgi:excisionase family DNA binding protein
MNSRQRSAYRMDCRGFQKSNQPLTLSVEAAAQRIGMSRSRLYWLVRYGGVRAVRIANRLRVPVSEVAALRREMEMLGQ